MKIQHCAATVSDVNRKSDTLVSETRSPEQEYKRRVSRVCLFESETPAWLLNKKQEFFNGGIIRKESGGSG